MAQERKRYPLEYRQRLVELCRAGRTAESLGRDFEPSAQTIRELGEASGSGRRTTHGRPDDGRAGREPAAPA